MTAATVVANAANHHVVRPVDGQHVHGNLRCQRRHHAGATSKVVTYGSTYGALATTSRTGYTFNGWFTAASGGTQVTTATVVTNAANHTLYAQWTANTYTVTFDANGGTTPAPTSKVVTYGCSLRRPGDHQPRELHLQRLVHCSQRRHPGDGSYGCSHRRGPYALRPVEHTANHTVTFKANGGTGTDYTQTTNTSTALTPNTFTRTGYTFDHWNTPG